MTPEPLTVVTADDHAIVRDGLKLLFAAQDGMEIVGEAEDVDAVLSVVAERLPSVLVLDLNLHGRSSLDVIEEVLRLSPGTRVVMLTMEGDAEYARAALRRGASGYLLKEASHEELVRAVRDAADGRTYLQPQLGAQLAAGAAHPGDDEGPLSEREREVLRLLALGHTNREIAELMHLSTRTIDAHRSHLQDKLRRSSRAELVRYAIEQRILEL